MALSIQLNGAATELADLDPGVSVSGLVEALGLKADRIAVELDGTIVRRHAWSATPVAAQARLEIVHFVGGGASSGSGSAAYAARRAGCTR